MTFKVIQILENRYNFDQSLKRKTKSLKNLMEYSAF